MRRSRVLVAAAVLCLAGCGGGPKYAPVSGSVFLDGKPLAGAVVIFQPIGADPRDTGGVGSVGLTDAAGAFTLKVVGEDRPGALVGTHQVRISTMTSPPNAGDEAIKTPERVPRKYHREALPTFEVKPEGHTDARFELHSD